MAVDWPLADKQAAVNQFMSAVTRCLFSPARTAPISHCAASAVSESHAPASPVNEGAKDSEGSINEVGSHCCQPASPANRMISTMNTFVTTVTLSNLLLERVPH